MEELRDRLLCLFTKPGSFFKEVEICYPSAILTVMGITFVHLLIILLMGVGSISWLVIGPIKVLLFIVFYSAMTSIILRLLTGKSEWGQVFKILCIGYFWTMTMLLLTYPLLWLPKTFLPLVLLLFFGIKFFSAYLMITGIAHRLQISPWKVFASMTVTSLVCILLNITGSTINFIKGVLIR